MTFYFVYNGITNVYAFAHAQGAIKQIVGIKYIGLSQLQQYGKVGLCLANVVPIKIEIYV